MRLLVELVDDFLLLTLLIFIIALADITTRAPDSVAADVLFGRPLELVQLVIQHEERPWSRCALVKHRLELECGCLEPPKDRVAGITNALESRLWRETGENRPRLGIDVALTPDDVGGLR